MKNYRSNDYALNKYSKGIVYKFVDGIVEITLEEYLHSNPDKTEADFIELKAISDEIYYQQCQQEHRTNRLNVSLNEINEGVIRASLAIDIELIHKEEEQKVIEATKKLLHSKKLTPIQERRFLLYFFKGLSTGEIAKLEGVRQQAVWYSLMWVKKKLKKFYEE